MTASSNQKRILVTDQVHPVMLETLRNWGYSVDYQPEITYEETGERIWMYHGLIINSKINCRQSFLEKADKLEFIGRLGSGMEIVDIPYAQSRGIAVFSAPEGNALAVAEHAVGMILSLNNHLNRADREVRAGMWQRAANRGRELSGLQVGIIGFGNTGSTLAGLLKGFRCKIVAYDQYAPWKINNALAEEVSLEKLLADSDIVSLHVSHPVQNHYFVDDAFLAALKPGCLLINTSRGNVIDTHALLRSLQNGKLRGAGLDVFENENPESFSQDEREMYHQLYTLDQVLLTPHIAGWTEESLFRISTVLLQKIKVWKSASYSR